ncbi:MAG: hypothetical protein ACREPD_15620 [Stenotrophomonas sp.]|uniref:hypothetical protein n=1 Tax=Gammaproteobacteria TaxID=1236 RepID=UPI003D6D46B0
MSPANAPFQVHRINANRVQLTGLIAELLSIDATCPACKKRDNLSLARGLADGADGGATLTCGGCTHSSHLASGVVNEIWKTQQRRDLLLVANGIVTLRDSL